MIRFILFAALVLAGALAKASVSVTVNGTNYTIPQTNERGWGNSVTTWIQAMSQYSLQPTGGTFALTADVNFGANYGLKSKYFSTRDANPSTAGLLRLTNSDTIGWRNTANGGNLLLSVDSSDRLLFNGVILPSASAGAFQDSTFYIYDQGDATKHIAFQASGITTATTRTITMPDADVNLGALTNSNIDAAAAIAYSKLNLSGSVVNADIGIAAGIALTKLAALNNSIVPVTNGSGILSSSSVTATTLGYLDATSSVQTQIDAKQARSTLTTKGDIYVATASATVARQGIGSDGQFLQADSTQTNGLKWASANNNLSVTSKTTTYTVTTSDDVILCSTSGGAWTLTLPTAVGNSGKAFRIVKTEASTNLLTVDGDGSETINGAANRKMVTIGEAITIVSDGANWQILDSKTATKWTSFTPTGSWSTNSTYTGRWRRVGDSIEVYFRITLAGAPTTANLTVNIPNNSVWTIDTAKLTAASGDVTLGAGNALDGGTRNYVLNIGYNSTTAVNAHHTETTNAGNVSEAGPITFGNTDTVTGHYIVPITNFEE